MKSEATSGNAKKISPNADLPFTGKLWDINAHSPLFALPSLQMNREFARLNVAA